MRITLVPDSSIASAPAGLAAAVEAAAAIYEQDFPGDYNVNISYGWGTFDNAPSSALTSSSSGAYSLGGGTSFPVSYSQLKGWRTANAVSSAQIAAVATLPASSASFPGDPSSFFVSFAEEKALGVFSGDGSAIDGSIGFNIVKAASTPEDWEPAALTEIAHALGWDSIAQGGSLPDAADLFRYSSPGQYGWTSGQSAYFSIDGGATDLADFATSTSFDQTLFSSLPADDPLRLPFTSAATTLTAFDVEALSVIGFGAANVSPPPPRRFMAGGSSPDILWQNTSTGEVSIWEMNGNSVVARGPAGDPGPTWRAVGIGDFNDDGHSDILWQNSDGQASIWEMNGINVISKGPAGPNPGPTWRVVGTGDFNGDGHSDILFQNTSTGQVSIWEMNGDTRIGGGLVGDPGPSWTALGTGDFNDDGRSDILLRNANGETAIWEKNGTSVIAHATLASNPGLSWSEVATGYFNGDGHSDILWQNANGQVSIWEMNGTNRIGGGPVSPNPGATWLAA